MEINAVVISCGASKIQTTQPVQAWRLYTGGYYQKMLQYALSFTPNVYILSAGYGLLRLNDMVETYDFKMDNKRAKQFKKLKLVQFSGGSLLGKTYKQAVIGDLVDLIEDPTLGMGSRMGYVTEKMKGKQVLLNLEELEDGILRTYVAHEA